MIISIIKIRKGRLWSDCFQEFLTASWVISLSRKWIASYVKKKELWIMFQKERRKDLRAESSVGRTRWKSHIMKGSHMKVFWQNRIRAYSWVLNKRTLLPPALVNFWKFISNPSHSTPHCFHSPSTLLIKISPRLLDIRKIFSSHYY